MSHFRMTIIESRAIEGRRRRGQITATVATPRQNGYSTHPRAAREADDRCHVFLLTLSICVAALLSNLSSVGKIGSTYRFVILMHKYNLMSGLCCTLRNFRRFTSIETRQVSHSKCTCKLFKCKKKHN